VENKTLSHDPAVEYFLNTSDPLILPSRVPSPVQAVPSEYPRAYGDLAYDPALRMDPESDYEKIVVSDELERRARRLRQRDEERHRDLTSTPGPPHR
jgi:hypothetical protein